MSAHATQIGRTITFERSTWTVALLILVTASLAWIAAGVLTKQIDRDHQHEYQGAAADATGFGVVARLDGARTVQALLKEILKQAIDQPGHLLIAAFPIWLSRRLTGVPWYGWPVVPLLAYREWLQWPSNRWWDPPLDWAFLALGIIVATWLLGALRRPTPLRT
jgi:hypothetical protein